MADVESVSLFLFFFLSRTVPTLQQIDAAEAVCAKGTQLDKLLLISGVLQSREAHSPLTF